MLIKGFSLIFLGIGIFVLMQVLMPVLAFKAWEISNFDQSQLLIDPNPKILSGGLVEGQVLGVSIQNIGNFPAFISQNTATNPPYSEFKLTIPKINLYDINVKVNSNDFNLNLAHLPGSVLPGEKGNVFITGHSSIWPQLKDQQQAFFANLPSVKKGDEVLISALGQRYTYEVIGFRVVEPEDLSVVNPPDSSGRYLSLMTCVPPGFNTKRLIVVTRLK